MAGSRDTPPPPPLHPLPCCLFPLPLFSCFFFAAVIAFEKDGAAVVLRF